MSHWHEQREAPDGHSARRQADAHATSAPMPNLSVTDIIEDAMSAVTAARGWSLTPDRWPKVDHALGDLQSALDARDWPAVRRKTTVLELLSPTRANDADRGREPGVPPPPVTWDRTVRLIRSLTPPDRAISPDDDRRGRSDG
ncbi:CATRA system-associated protein [Catellatospora sp. NPDC049111]|uniref:CATRA system-associated protein n=1 Tax=Catellatospora sp. NPDC049111 TaxID=3155271 RepID=UPI0033D54845